MATYNHVATVLTVRSAPVVKAESNARWEFVLWLNEPAWTGHPLNFRPHLDELAATLSKYRPTMLRLPAYQQDENFVFGRVRFGERELGLYYEDDFAPYISINSPERDDVADVLAVILPDLSVREDP